jgi:hypothetical protein
VAQGYNSGYSQGVKPSSPGPRPLEWNLRSTPSPDSNINPTRQAKLLSANTSNQQGLNSSGRQGQGQTNSRTSSSSSIDQGHNPRTSSMIAAAGTGGTGASGSARSSPARTRPGSDTALRSTTRVPITPSGYPLAQACMPQELGRSHDPRVLATAGNFIAAAVAGATAGAAGVGTLAVPGAGAFQPAPLQWGVKASGPGTASVAAGGSGALPKGLGFGAGVEKQVARTHKESGSDGVAGSGRTFSSISTSAPRAGPEVLNARGHGTLLSRAAAASVSTAVVTSRERQASADALPMEKSSTSSNYGASSSSSSSYATQTRPPSQQMSEGLSRLKQLSSARLVSRLTTPPDGKQWVHCKLCCDKSLC